MALYVFLETLYVLICQNTIYRLEENTSIVI